MRLIAYANGGPGNHPRADREWAAQQRQPYQEGRSAVVDNVAIRKAFPYRRMMRRLLTGFITLGLLIGMIGFAEQENMDDQEDALAGGRLSPTQVQALEKAVQENPEEAISARKKLLGYYFLHRQPESARARLDHIVWFVKNRPETQIAGLPYAELNPILDRASYEQVKKLWLEQVEKQPANLKVLGNAAHYFLLHDRAIAEKFLKQAQQADAKNPAWSERLGHLYSLQDKDAKALEQFELAQSADPEAVSRFYRLSDLAKSAFRANELEKATTYANELLTHAKNHPNDWNYGNALHHGNNVLGLVALQKGKQKEAVAYLLSAGKTPGSPQLDSFGPNMSLAKALLAKGEKEAVLQYFELCRVFWKRKELDEWKKQIEQGKTPNFGGNLSY